MHGNISKTSISDDDVDGKLHESAHLSNLSHKQRTILALAYGMVCHLLFLAGAGSMVLAMYFGLQTGLGTLPEPWAWFANLLLILQFPIGHSLLLTNSGRSFLKKLAPAGAAKTLQSTSYVIVASVQLILLFQLWTPSGIIWWQAEGLGFYAVTALYGLSWAFVGLAILNSGWQLQSGALGWLSLLQNRIPRYPDMPTYGLYLLLRHPIYLAFILTLWTTPVWTPDQLVLAVFWTIYCVAAPLFKEKRFLTLYGERYKIYQTRTPYMIPFISSEKGGTVERNLNIYDGVADKWWSDDIAWLRTLRNMVDGRLATFDESADWHGKTVLDLGCAGGFMAEALAGRGAKVTGIDPAVEAIRAARDHADQSGYEIEYEVGVGEDLPYETNTFDYVVCVDVLEHVNDLEKVLDEVNRVLKPGGTFFFDTIAKNRLASFAVVTVAEDVLGLLPRGTHDPDLFISPERLSKLLEKRFFSVSKLKGLGPRGLDRNFTPTFGIIPTTAIIYMGHAIKPG